MCLLLFYSFRCLALVEIFGYFTPDTILVVDKLYLAAADSNRVTTKFNVSLRYYPAYFMLLYLLLGASYT